MESKWQEPSLTEWMLLGPYPLWTCVLVIECL